MNLEKFQGIASKARTDMEEYLDMYRKATWLPEYGIRKEDSLLYWVAVVAFQQGYQTGLGNI